MIDSMIAADLSLMTNIWDRICWKLLAVWCCAVKACAANISSLPFEKHWVVNAFCSRRISSWKITAALWVMTFLAFVLMSKRHGHPENAPHEYSTASDATWRLDFALHSSPFLREARRIKYDKRRPGRNSCRWPTTFCCLFGSLSRINLKYLCQFKFYSVAALNFSALDTHFCGCLFDGIF